MNELQKTDEPLSSNAPTAGQSKHMFWWWDSFYLKIIAVYLGITLSGMTLGGVAFMHISQG